MDHNLVIPEYLVEYEYILKNANQNKVADFNETVALLETNDDEFISAKNIATYEKDINNIYNMLVEEISVYQFESIDEKNNPNLEIQASDLDRFDIGNLKVMLINYFKYCLSRSNLFYELNENLLFEGTDEFDIKKLNIEDPSVLQFANLSNLKIKSMPFISSFINLEVLVISYNQLTNLVELENLKNLRKLDASHNRIATLAGISSLKLEHLNISHNSLTSEESLNILQLAGDTLKEVNILFNPFEDEHKA
jgi:Leucine-rich repeat (LRR) protein